MGDRRIRQGWEDELAWTVPLEIGHNAGFGILTGRIRMAVALVVGLGWIVSLCLHEFGHAIVAYWGGDTSVKDKGYLTLNPLKYTDPGLSLAMPLVFLLLGGIALPGGAVYINSHKLRSRAWKSAVSAAGPAMSAVSAVLLSMPFWAGFAPPVSDALNLQIEQDWVWSALSFLIAIEVFAVLLNLLPIPSLDGYGILEPWLPEAVQLQFNRFRKYGILFLFGLLWFVPPASQALWTISSTVAEILGVSPTRVSLGYILFRRNAAVVLVITIAAVIIYQRFFRSRHETLLEKGDRATKAGKYEEAIALYDQALQHQPNFTQALHQKGWALVSLGHFSDALAAFDQALEHEPDFTQALYGRAWTLMTLGRWPDAKEAFSVTTQSIPTFYDGWLHLGKVLVQTEQPEDAQAAFNRAIHLDPKRDEAWFHQIMLLMGQGRYEEVIILCDRARQKHPKWEEALYIKATLLRVLERYAEAIALYDQFLKTHPAYAEGWFQRGECRRHLGQWAGAIASYTQALELAPNHQEAQRRKTECEAQGKAE